MVWYSDAIKLSFINEKLNWLRERKNNQHTFVEGKKQNWGLKNHLVCEQWRLGVVNFLFARSTALSEHIDFAERIISHFPFCQTIWTGWCLYNQFKWFKCLLLCARFLCVQQMKIRKFQMSKYQVQQRKWISHVEN